MNIDYELISFLNQFSRYSGTVDRAIGLLSHNNLLKGGVIVSILWWLWFKGKQFSLVKCKYVISTIFSSIIAIVIARTLSYTLPFRDRPLNDRDLIFNLPEGIPPNVFQKWSSFPSDHAVVFFALSTGMLFISRKIGIFAFIYTFVFIAFPRVYLGFHFPSDILFGAIIGIFIAWIANKLIVKAPVTQAILDWSNSKPAYFYMLFFIISFELANLFHNSRSIFLFAYKVLQKVFTYQFA